ncbi:glycoside hydrolase family 125 protein [Candidatus Bathyarchaeota archaeon]|nr:glycoside hydrolase family 125 protein [Candidatus Bathyarchaeota archaeon]
MLGYLDRDNPVYQNTRRLIANTASPYFMFGPVLNATGGQHIGPGKGAHRAAADIGRRRRDRSKRGSSSCCRRRTDWG